MFLYFLVIVLIILVVVALMTFLFLALSGVAVAVSRVTFSLLAGLVLHQNSVTLIPDSGFLNFLAWAVIVLIVVYLLAMLPRVDLALKFFCNILVSVFTVLLVFGIFGGLISSMMKKTFEVTVGIEIIIKVVCLGFSIYSLLTQKRKASYEATKNKFMLLLERVAAALMYGAALTFISLPLSSSSYTLGDGWIIAIMAVTTAGAFLLDLKLTKIGFFERKDPDVVHMPR